MDFLKDDFENFDFGDFDSLVNNDEFNQTEPYPKPTELRISTMTATCKSNIEMNLEYITRIVKPVEYFTENCGILKIIYGKEILGMCKKDLDGKKNNKKKVFFNQATIVFRIRFNKLIREINIKLFSNGGVQMTGLKSKEEGIKAINNLFQILKDCKGEIEEKDKDDKIIKKNIKLISDFSKFKIDYFNIVLINSDFAANFEIKRDVLHKMLQNQYHIFSTYEPCIYPGVNSKYYWNKSYKNYPFKGKCYCDNYCEGKGKGNGESDCKKVTISIFQSGNVIITGARSLEQISDAYIFINNVFKKEYNKIKKIKPSFLEKECKKKKTKKITYLKKSIIKFLENDKH